MADYKDIIAGTINSIAEKVKEVAGNGTVRNIYDQGANRAKSFAHMTKLNLAINGETEELKRVYTEIGKLYYDQVKDAPEGFFAPLFSQVQTLLDSIAAKEDEIKAMKAEFDSDSDASVDADIDVEVCNFDDVVDKTEDDGKNE